jgi:hypothetical protein
MNIKTIAQLGKMCYAGNKSRKRMEKSARIAELQRQIMYHTTIIDGLVQQLNEEMRKETYSAPTPSYSAPTPSYSGPTLWSIHVRILGGQNYEAHVNVDEPMITLMEQIEDSTDQTFDYDKVIYQGKKLELNSMEKIRNVIDRDAILIILLNK